jgi:hypothetical protein
MCIKACPGTKRMCASHPNQCRDCCDQDANQCPPAPVNGTVTCEVGGFCTRKCDTNEHRICGSNPGVCQLCCDDNHCKVYDSDATCVAGSCVCSENRPVCDHECTDVSSEPNHCGTCGNACPSGMCVNGVCRNDTCRISRCPPHVPIEDCEFSEICDGERECSGGVGEPCTCPVVGPNGGRKIDCNGDGFCESCGRCGVNCGNDPGTDLPGECCPDGRCSCGRKNGQPFCCPSGTYCYTEPNARDNEGVPIPEAGYEEVCYACTMCNGSCCAACSNGNCVHFQPPRGGSIRGR